MKEFIEHIKQLDKKTFYSIFKDEEECLRVLSEHKWKDGFRCRKCGHTNYCKGRTPYSRRCTRCKYEESARAFTLFHRCHIPLTVGFSMMYRICNDEEISTYKLSDIYSLRQMTCWRFKKNVLKCIEDDEEEPQPASEIRS